MLLRNENDVAPDDQHYMREKRNTFVFGNIFLRTITLAVFDIYVPAVSTESQDLYLFIIKVRIYTPNFYFLIFFW